jgi:type III restriction enzyme
MKPTPAPLPALPSGLLERVTPTTADLLAWWFGPERVGARARQNFDRAQRQAILDTVFAHEVAGPDRGHGPFHHACYGVELATDADRTAVLHALLVWQLLNLLQARASGRDDPRFTQRFLVVASGLIAYERLLGAFCGLPLAGGHGARDFGTSELVRRADLLIPEASRHAVFGFVNSHVCGHTDLGVKTSSEGGLIAIAHRRRLVEGRDDDDQGLRRRARGQALRFLAQLPDLMVFNDEAHPIPGFGRDRATAELAWQASLHRIAAPKGPRFVQVDFSAPPPHG